MPHPHRLQPRTWRYAHTRPRVRQNASSAQQTNPTSSTSLKSSLYHPRHTPACPQLPPSSFPSSLPLPRHGHPTSTSPTATTPKTVSKAMASTQTATTTMEAATHAPDSPQRRCATRDTPLHKVVRTHSSDHIVRSTEQLCQPHRLQRRPRSLSKLPRCSLFAPIAPVMHYEPTTMPHASNATATSSSMHPSSMTVPPALPRSRILATARKRRDTSTEPPEQPQPHPPSLAHTAQKHVILPPHMPHTVSTSPTTPSTPVDNPRLLPVLPALSMDLALPQLTCKRAVSTPSAPSAATGTAEPCATVISRPLSLVSPPSSPAPLCSTPVSTCFDWAEDAATLPMAPSSHLRDLSGLRTGRQQPFGTLRRHTR
jgi:hypothetical protein